MPPLRAAFRFRRLVLLLCLPSCYAWTPVALTPPPQFARRTSVRVERAGQKQPVYFARPRVVGDSLLGQRAGSPIPLSVALADVRRADQRRFSVARTVSLLVVGGVLAGVVAAGLADNSGYNFPASGSSCYSIIC